MCRLFFILCCFVCALPVFSFEHRLELKKEAFAYKKYNFCIVDVIDARANKQREVGYTSHGKSVGNADLAASMKACFAGDTLDFLKTTRIILVINQVNFNPVADRFTGFALGFDYYKMVDGRAVQIYSQFISGGSDTWDTDKGINKTFSKTVAEALLKLKSQLWYYKPFSTEAIEITTLEKRLTAPASPTFDPCQLKEGLYFNINQLYDNQPALTSGYVLPDDSLLAEKEDVNIDSKTFLIKQAYAFVKSGQLYIYLHDLLYYPATPGSDGQLYILNAIEFPDAHTHNYYHARQSYSSRAISSTWAGVVMEVIGAVAFGAMQPDSHYMSLKVDLETGELNL